MCLFEPCHPCDTSPWLPWAAWEVCPHSDLPGSYPELPPSDAFRRSQKAQWQEQGVATSLCQVVPSIHQEGLRRARLVRLARLALNVLPNVCPAGCPDYIHGVDLSYNLATENERRARAVAMRKRAPIRAQEEVATTPTFEPEDIPGSTEEPPVRGTCWTGIFACAYQIIGDRCVLTSLVHHFFRTTLWILCVGK